MRQMTTQEFAICRPTFIECWSSKLARLSMPHERIPLTKSDVMAIGLGMPRFHKLFDCVKDGVRGDIRRVATKMSLAFNKFPFGSFVRLGSSSPIHDSRRSYALKNRSLCAEEGMAMLMDSETIAYDLLDCLENNYEPSIFVRRWQPMNPWQEFRMFIRENILVGISQYYLYEAYPQIEERSDAMERAIRIFAYELIPDCHLNNFVADVYVSKKLDYSGFNVTLIDINPFHPILTDGGLFDWELTKDDFDESFRYSTKVEPEPVTNPSPTEVKDPLAVHV